MPRTPTPLARTWWIEPGRLLGGPYPGAHDPDERDRKLAALAVAGIQHVVCLQEEDEKGSGGRGFPEYIGRLRHVAAREIEWRRFPIRDLTAPSAAQMVEILAHLAALDGPIYVHCWGGHGRTGTVAGCWLREQGLSGAQALAAISAARSHDPYLRDQPAPQTSDQIDLVRRWGSLVER